MITELDKIFIQTGKSMEANVSFDTKLNLDLAKPRATYRRQRVLAMVVLSLVCLIMASTFAVLNYYGKGTVDPPPITLSEDPQSGLPSDETPDDTQNNEPNNSSTETSLLYYTFEEACLLANTVIIANYIGSSELYDMDKDGYSLTYIKNEFIVKDTLFGNPTEKILIYTQGANLPIIDDKGIATEVSPCNQNDISFEPNVDYLLILIKNRDLYTFDTRYSLINEAIVRLDDLTLSQMYNEPLSSHIKGIEFTDETTREEMISYVKNITKNNTPAYEYIKSDKMEDIINESPYVITISIKGNLNAVRGVFGEWDIYDSTVIQVLKGEIKAEIKTRIVFFPDTVKPGEEWIVAAVPPDGRDEYLHLTSKNSLIPYDQIDEVKQIIGIENLD